METYINFTVNHVTSIKKANDNFPDVYCVSFNRSDDISIYGPYNDEVYKKFRHAVETCIRSLERSYYILMRIKFKDRTFDEFMDNVANTGRVDGVLTVKELDDTRTVHDFEITRVNPRTAFTINRVVEIRKAKMGNPDDDKFLIFFEKNEDGEPKIDIYSEDHDTISAINKKLKESPATHRYYLVVDTCGKITEPNCKDGFFTVDGYVKDNKDIIITSYKEVIYKEEKEKAMATYDFTITSIMGIEKPTMKGYDPNIHFVTFKSLDSIEYKGSSREFHDYIFTFVGRNYDNANGDYYSLGMIILPEMLRYFEEAIDPQMLKCRLHVTNTRENVGGQWIPTVQFKFTVKEVVSVYEKEEKDMKKNDATVGDVYNRMTVWQRKVCQFMIAEALKNATRTFTPDSIKKVIYNDPATIIFWSDGTKTVVKCMEDEDYDPEKGFMAAVTKKVFGDKYGWVMRHQVKPAAEYENKVDTLMESIADALRRKRVMKENAMDIRVVMMRSGATKWELDTFDRFVRKYIADKEDK